VIERLRALGHDPEPLAALQATAFSSSLELLGALGLALRAIERQPIADPELRLAIAELWKQVRQVWPRM
jgi:hypothetical protein